MKQYFKLSLFAILSVAMLSTACKKKPSNQIYNQWEVVNVESTEMDSTTIAKISSDGLVYTFSKGGEYTYSGAFSGSGTFSINEAGSQLTTTEDGKTNQYSLILSAESMKLNKGSETMEFKIKK